MKAIIYISEAETSFENDDLIILSNNAKIANDQHQITGYLWYHESHFIQYIEGDKDKVDILMDNIKKDRRHFVLYQISENIQQRRFEGWSMEHIGLRNEIGSGTRALVKSQFIMLTMSQKSNIKLPHKVWHLADMLTKHSDIAFANQ